VSARECRANLSNQLLFRVTVWPLKTVGREKSLLNY
jgi:hypothetical protein